MKTKLMRLAAMLSAAGTAAALSAGTASAHTGEDASTGHVIQEFGLWALGVAAAVAVLVLAFRIRARLRRERAA